MLPKVNKTPPIMNASETPVKGMVDKATPFELVKEITIDPLGPTVAVDMKVMTKGWQRVVLN